MATEPIHVGAPLQPVPANDLPDWMANASARFGVIGDAWKVTPQSSIVRGIQIAPGTGWSDGILSTFDDTNVPQPFGLPVSTQARWHMVCSRVDWQDPLTRTFHAIPSTNSSMALPLNSPDFVRKPGERADWPIALVMVPQNAMNVSTIVDLRLWRGDNGWLMAKSELVEQYLTRPGTVVEVNGKLRRLGWDANGFPLWQTIAYTDQADQPFRHFQKYTATDIKSGGQYTNLHGFTTGPGDQGDDTGLSYNAGTVTVSRAGLYHLEGSVRYIGGINADKFAAFFADGQRYRGVLNGATGSVNISRTLYLNAGAQVTLQGWQDSGSTLRVPADPDLTYWTIRRLSR
ncbi:hypothetical protein [Arthrobacter sp. USHLN218]|uniref:hypothetical protein n=1 Tax=Arthrobacter sp. USHLN218 TaxID=3081232 RepID=UPI003015DA68